MIRVRLLTSAGELVYVGLVTSFVTGPPVVVALGNRFFVYSPEDNYDSGDALARDAAERLGAPRVYREVMLGIVLPVDSVDDRADP